jgi:hypothetical protein
VAYVADTTTLYSIVTFWLWPYGFSFALIGIYAFQTLFKHIGFEIIPIVLGKIINLIPLV